MLGDDESCDIDGTDDDKTVVARVAMIWFSLIMLAVIVLLTPIFASLVPFRAEIPTPDEARVQCVYGDVYSVVERQQHLTYAGRGFPVGRSTTGDGRSMRYPFEKTVSVDITFIRRRMTCSNMSATVIEYVEDAVGDEPVNTTLQQRIQKIQSLYPRNQSITMWYYPILRFSVDDYQLRAEPLIYDTNALIIGMWWFLYALMASLPALGVAVLWLACVWPGRAQSRLLSLSIVLYKRVGQIVVARRRL